MTKRDYKSTVFLPANVLDIRANLPTNEPTIMARWEQEDIYAELRKLRKGEKTFVLHDGPPYANGNLHMGHALNKVLKDIVVRGRTLMGYDAPLVPGWDCHGLPIEWAVLKDYQARGINKNDVDPVQFRSDCRTYAAGWVDTQRDQFKRLGVMADWENPYLTMNYSSEAAILGELYKFAKSGLLYRDAKPVFWSPAEQTGLADSDVEYKDVTSTQVDVGFKVLPYKDAAFTTTKDFSGAYIVVWTTTPWTLPANRALAYNPGLSYGLFTDGQRKYILADNRKAAFETRTGYVLERLDTITRNDFEGTVCQHPMFGAGGFYEASRPLLAADFVTAEQGTGFVHLAPDHGENDFKLCAEHGIGPRYAVGPDGRYPEQWPWLDLEGSVTGAKFNAPDGPVCSALRNRGVLFAASHDFRHSYPHSDRSKAKLIMRATPQWFISLDHEEPAIGGTSLRDTAMNEIAKTSWYPPKAINRITSMVADRPDWLVSRQRLWGVPLALYLKKGTNEYLFDEEVNGRVLAAFEQGGADAWYSADHASLLGANYDLDDYEPVQDVLDVWFDSGSTHSYVLGGKQADLYLEGSDQHRGWFQASLLESCGTTGRAPFKAVLTHGFALDDKGRKMAKSVGNVVDPLVEIAVHGADVLRLWVAMTDSTEDVKIGKKVLEGSGETYKKLRNTLRYMLGALHGSDTKTYPLDFSKYPPLERYMLSRLSSLNLSLPRKLETYDFNGFMRELFNFCNDELSSFYFDIRKDVLYCDPENSETRQCYLRVLNLIFRSVVGWLKPVLVFTAEEVWQARYPGSRSVHLEPGPCVVGFQDLKLEANWQVVKRYRTKVNETVEKLVKAGKAKGAADSKMILSVPAADLAILREADFKSVSLLAELHLSEDAVAAQTESLKCQRCWKREPDVVEPEMLCGRCEIVVKEMGGS